MTPHRQLIQARDDESLRTYVQAWGPLRPELDNWCGADPILDYRKVRNRITALARLLASAGDPEEQRSALLESMKFTPDGNEGGKWSAGWTQAYKGAQIDRGTRLSVWLEKATPKQLEIFTTTYISHVAAPFAATRFTAVRKGSGYVLRDLLGFKSVVHALYWMVWQDVYRERQFQFCSECRRLYQPDTRHERKYCSEICAHRRTAREWQQRKREKERKTDGTKETR